MALPGALCGGKYHSIYWELPDPTNPFNRTYGLASFDVSKSNATFIEIPLPNNYYGVWCSPAKLGGDLLVVMAKRGSDPLRMKEFFVQSLSTDATKVTTLAGPIAAPAKEYIPIADGIFSFDGTSQMWMSFSIGSNESHGIFHADKGITHVVDLETQADTTYETRDEQGYLVLTQAVPPGSKTWGVLKKLSRKDRRLSLTFVDLQLGPGGSMSVRKVGDALLIANSQGLPGGQCGNTLLTFNTDDYDGPFQRYYNITAIDTQTGKAIWNLDTLTALPGSRRAFVTGFACQ